ncbi:MAG: hypothetical protein Ct9H90mP7_5000 [Candidatus Neomarinimicrobiota bacterium]|nr:MAG: hypothetical protein Ct9H90mP7_5000 [Candidatus Neomarinimicrobiota bacterium]
MKNFHWYFFILFYSIFFIGIQIFQAMNDEEIDSFMKVISERSGNDEQNIHV